jgi:hypothetical protein
MTPARFGSSSELAPSATADRLEARSVAAVFSYTHDPSHTKPGRAEVIRASSTRSSKRRHRLPS